MSGEPTSRSSPAMGIAPDQEMTEALAKPLKPGLPRFARNDQLLRTIVIARRNDEAISSPGDFCKRLLD